MSNNVLDAVRRAADELGWNIAMLAANAGGAAETASLVLRGESCGDEDRRRIFSTVIGGLATRFLSEPEADLETAAAAEWEKELSTIMPPDPPDPRYVQPESATGLLPRAELESAALARLTADRFRVEASPSHQFTLAVPSLLPPEKTCLRS